MNVSKILKLLMIGLVAAGGIDWGNPGEGPKKIQAQSLAGHGGAETDDPDGEPPTDTLQLCSPNGGGGSA